MNLPSITERLGAAASAIGGWFPDLLIAGGAVGVAYGAWLVYQPAGFIVGGALALAGGLRMTRVSL